MATLCSCSTLVKLQLWILLIKQGCIVTRACTLNRSNTICANSEIYGLAGVGKIPYGFVQNSNGMRIIDMEWNTNNIYIMFKTQF